jgi:hypothetical protein
VKILRGLLVGLVCLCIASSLSLGGILAMSAVRGNLQRSTLTQIVALLNGIDIQGRRLQQALDSSQDTPQPTYQEVVAARARTSAGLDAREAALERYRLELDNLRQQLERSREEFDQRRLAFENRLAELAREAESSRLQQAQELLENLPVELAKTQVLKLIEQGHLEDVVKIVKAMPPERRKKMLGEFDDNAASQKLYEILDQLLIQDPRRNLIRAAGETPPDDRTL